MLFRSPKPLNLIFPKLLTEPVDVLLLAARPRVAVRVEVVEDPLKLVADSLECESMIVGGVEELILTIEDGLQPFEDSDDLRPDDGEEVRWVAACEGREGQC